MKRLIIAASLISLVGCSGTPYLRAGIGYKHGENFIPGNNVCDSKISGRFEAGVITENFIYGWAHHSQPFCGRPFNDKYEPFKSEFFMDAYKTF